MARRARTIAGKDYQLVVLRITGWDDKGRPSVAIIGHDDTTFDLADDKLSREFMTAFIPAHMAEPLKTKH